MKKTNVLKVEKELNKKVASCTLDVKEYNIIQADFIYPFTTENYEIAYNNGLNIQKAIDDYKAKGIKEIVFPSGNYPLCFHATNEDEVNYIIDSSGINISAYGCKFYIIYDDLDTGLNPYYTGDSTMAHKLCGIMFITDSDIKGCILEGDRCYRYNENTKYREGSYGIRLTENTNGNKIKDCIIRYFSGDGISNHRSMEQVATWNCTATSVTWDGTSFVSSSVNYCTVRHGISFADITKPFQIRGNGVTPYFIWSKDSLKIHCFDSNENYIGTVKVNQGEPFYFLPNSHYWYLEVTSGVEHDITSTQEMSCALGYGYFRNCTIENCEIAFNQRGGISNLPSSSLVKGCTIHDNGVKFAHMVAFYDSTKFDIDQEDWYIHSLNIDNCTFYNTPNSIIYRCNGINITNSKCYGNVFSLNYQVDFYAENTYFYGTCTMTTPASFGNKTAINCKFNSTKAPEIRSLVDDIYSINLRMDKILKRLDFLSENMANDYVSNHLVFNLDFKGLSGITTQIVEPINNITFNIQNNNDGSRITDKGILLKGYLQASPGTEVSNLAKSLDDSVDGITIEYFGLGFPSHILNAYTNECLIASSGSNIISAGFRSGMKAYNNGNEVTLTTELLTTFYDDGGNVIALTNANLNDYLNNDKYIHLVYKFNKNGNLNIRINGRELINNNQSTYENGLTFDYQTYFANLTYLYCLSGSLGDNTSCYCTSLRIYNKILNDYEIDNNIRYEIKRNGL